MKQPLYGILAAGLLATLPAAAQDYDPDPYYEAEQACNQQALDNTDRDYYEVFQDCMRQRGFGEEQNYNEDGNYEEESQGEEQAADY